MKCTVEIECTPLEARQFFGLPDVTPLQERMMSDIEKKMLAEMERFSPDAILKTWLSLYPQTPEQFQDMMARALNGGLAKRP
ncbi:DUF6489 family protein [Lichenihabitans sp. PAMC28606]|uniref:DUF6489 family protein n=1 Tax=Lichenihabitans sp. PAMC28606 TaxID=2880932 RepID=UPI001D0A9A3F|nr:DUF6489 family protein [Lichenihabitans sp. PAMC28606]UDL95397.1 DUF6489 family protein [Lichenihabitans sp. PAMC28606]